MSDTPTKSLRGLYGSLGYSVVLAVKAGITTPNVCPSGAALATASTPMMLLAPGLLSMTTGWPNCFCRPTVSRRAIWSVKPPAVYGTTMRMGRLGQPDCASAGSAAVASAAPVACTMRRRERDAFMVLSPVSFFK